MMPLIDEVIVARQAIKSYFHRRIRMIDKDISYEMFQVLNVLWRKSEVNQQEIANAVQKGKASLTPLIDNLTRRKLVARMEDSTDRRNNIISLTQDGKDFQKKFEPIIQEFCAQFSAGLEETTIRHLTSMLAKMSKEIND
jgi:DNA-binding MarR family transcriptional regulator